jgi:thiol-disulfide isomerase/thioredoxin
VNGVPSAEARIMIAERLPAVLVVAPELPAAVLLTPRTGTAQSFGPEFVAPQPDGTVALLSDVALVNEGRFQVAGRDVSFSVGGVAVVLKEKPFLLGLQDVAGMESYSAGYRDREREYSPIGSMLEELQSFPTDVRVRVYFGSWCPFCSMFVPRMMKVARELEGSRIEVEFYGLPQPATQDPLTTEHGIEAVPTGIVYIGGEEIGRISGNMWQSPEAALKVLLANHR